MINHRFIFPPGASPYPGMNSQEVINFLQDSYRMDKPKHCSDELYVVLKNISNSFYRDSCQIQDQGKAPKPLLIKELKDGAS